MSYPQQPGQYWANPAGQQPGFGPGFPGGPPPKRRNTGAIVAIVAMAVLVLGGVVTAVIVLSGDDKSSGEQTTAADESSDAQEPAVDDVPTANSAPASDPADDTGGGESAALSAGQEYVDAIAARDQAAATDLTCDKAGPGGLYELAGNAGWDLALTGEVEITSYGTATLEVTITTSSGSQNDAPGLLLEDQGGWCVTV